MATVCVINLLSSCRKTVALIFHNSSHFKFFISYFFYCFFVFNYVLPLFLCVDEQASVHFFRLLRFISLARLVLFHRFPFLVPACVTHIHCGNVLFLQVGLVVEFTAHIGRGFLFAPGTDRQHRAEHALIVLLWPTFAGACTTFLAVLPMTFSRITL